MLRLRPASLQISSYHFSRTPWTFRCFRCMMMLGCKVFLTGPKGAWWGAMEGFGKRGRFSSPSPCHTFSFLSNIHTDSRALIRELLAHRLATSPVFTVTLWVAALGGPMF